MRNTAYKLTAFTAILSAAGFMLRWLQTLRIYEEETGLAQRGAPISFVMAGVMVLAAAAFLGIGFWIRRYDAPLQPQEALAGQTFLYSAVWAVAVLMMLASGAAQLLSANAENYASDQIVIRRIVGVAALAAGAALALLMTRLSDPRRAGLRRFCAGVLILFAGLWLSAAYKTAASDPVIWRSAVEILALCASMLAFYYMAGYFYGQPNPGMSVTFCNLGAFLCIVSAIDDHPMAENLCFAATALILLTWSYLIVANLKPKNLPLEEAIKE